MILGNPVKFAILLDEASMWTSEGDTWRNGLLFLCVDGEIFPKKIYVATINTDGDFLIDMLKDIPVDMRIFNAEKERAFTEMYNLTFANGYDYTYKYFIAPPVLSDYHYYVFAVSNGSEIRIMATCKKCTNDDIILVREDNITSLEEEEINPFYMDNFSDVEISETFITVDELNKIILELKLVLDKK